MNPPSRSEINDMANVLRVLNGEAPIVNTAVESHSNSPKVELTEQQHMKNILTQMRSSNGGNVLGITPDMIQHMNRDTVMEDYQEMGETLPLDLLLGGKNMAEDGTLFDKAIGNLNTMADTDRELREAMATHPIENGVRIGQWEIVVDSHHVVPAYDVRDSNSKVVLARALTIYEAAKSMVTALNEGEIINSPYIRKILNYEGQYSRYRDQAVQLRKSINSLNESRNPAKYAIIEDRMNEAINKAEEAKRNLLEHVKTK